MDVAFQLHPYPLNYCFIYACSLFYFASSMFLVYFHMLPLLFMCQFPFLHALCFIPCLDPSYLCVNVWVYMPTCLISCLQLCLAQIYMFVCMSNASCLYPCIHARICVLPYLYDHIHMLRCTSTYLYVQIYASVCFGVWIFLASCLVPSPMLDLCAQMLYAMFMCLGLDLACHVMCYCSLFVPFISFS